MNKSLFTLESIHNSLFLVRNAFELLPKWQEERIERALEQESDGRATNHSLWPRAFAPLNLHFPFWEMRGTEPGLPKGPSGSNILDSLMSLGKAKLTLDSLNTHLI